MLLSELVRAQYDPSARVKSLARETKDVMDQLNREYKEPEKQEVEVKKADAVNAVSVRLTSKSI